MTESVQSHVPLKLPALGSRMDSEQEDELAARDYFLLGTLAEQTHNRDLLLRRYRPAEIERLVQCGYLWWSTDPSNQRPKGAELFITDKGREAWQSYRFRGP